MMDSRLTIFISFLLTITVLMFSGCSKKEDIPEVAQEESAQVIKNVVSHGGESERENAETENITLDHVLEVWNGGQQAKAAELFIGIDWESADIFDSESIFGISEPNFVTFSQDKQLEIRQKAMYTTKDIKGITKFLIELGKQQSNKMEMYRNALLACAERLSADDQLAVVQMVGKAVAGYTEKELPLP